MFKPRMFLCLVGGMIAIALIFVLFTIINQFSPVEFVMSWKNISAALLLSTIIGILSSIIPAMRAANLSPVEAMRS